MLRSYDIRRGEWDLPREGEFWDAVALAHELDRFGDGRTIAVVDDGFDLTVPQLASHELRWKNLSEGTFAHGTTVALLILAIAPMARLLLYPVKGRRGWDVDAIERALEDAALENADIINLSLGRPYPEEEIYPVSEWLHTVPRWEGMTENDLPYWAAEALGRLDGWRQITRRPDNSVGTIANATASKGIAVFAAVGNDSRYIYTPALEPRVFAVSFHRELRHIEAGLLEEAAAIDPTYSQSGHSDLSVIQPDNALGSSFATPLLSGFAALMVDRKDLDAYREVGRLSSMAAGLYVQLDDEPTTTWRSRREGVVDELFLKAVNANPHRHHVPSRRSPCPECAFLGSSSYINFALLKMNWSDLDGAEVLLRAAEAVAPSSPHAAANLGALVARRAQRAQQEERWDDVSRLLYEAARLQQKAADLRPEYKPYRARVAEFSAGAREPQKWILAP